MVSVKSVNEARVYADIAGFDVNIQGRKCGFRGFCGCGYSYVWDLADAKLYIGVPNNPQNPLNPQTEFETCLVAGNDNEADRCCSLVECVPGDIVTHLDGSRWKVMRTGSCGAAWLGAGAVWLGSVDADLSDIREDNLRPVISNSPFGEQFFCLGHYDPDADDWGDAA